MDTYNYIKNKSNFYNIKLIDVNINIKYIQEIVLNNPKRIYKPENKLENLGNLFKSKFSEH